MKLIPDDEIAQYINEDDFLTTSNDIGLSLYVSERHLNILQGTSICLLALRDNCTIIYYMSAKGKTKSAMLHQALLQGKPVYFGGHKNHIPNHSKQIGNNVWQVVV